MWKNYEIVTISEKFAAENGKSGSELDEPNSNPCLPPEQTPVTVVLLCQRRLMIGWNFSVVVA